MSPYALSSAPHIRTAERAETRLWWWNAALLPYVLAALGTFGAEAFLVMCSAVSGALLGQTGARFLLGRTQRMPDARGLYMGLVLALLLGVESPWWAVMLAAFLGVAIGEECFGGLGRNLFHPALVAWMFFRMMTVPFGNEPESEKAFLLYLSRKTDVDFSLKSLLWGVTGAACLAQASLLATVFSAVFLMARRFVKPALPILFFLGMYGCARALGLNAKAEIFLTPSLFAAFFLITDPGTSPASRIGKYLYALTCGVCFVAAGVVGGRVEASFYMLLVLNAFVPFIDRYVRWDSFTAFTRPPKRKR